MKIEKTEIWLTCDQPLEGDGRAVRGFFGNLYRNRPEFHGHRGNTLIYKHPLIQYKVFGGSALIIGLKDGAYLLKAVPELEDIEIYYKRRSVIKHNTCNQNVPFGLTDGLIPYSFATPWVGLNENNYQLYLSTRDAGEDTRVLLDRILIGHILSMCKSVGYVVKGKVRVNTRLREDVAVEIKEDVKLLAFNGEFETNFLIPEFWGIGGKVSLGYGTVKYANRDKHNEIN